MLNLCSTSQYKSNCCYILQHSISLNEETNYPQHIFPLGYLKLKKVGHCSNNPNLSPMGTTISYETTEFHKIVTDTLSNHKY